MLEGGGGGTTLVVRPLAVVLLPQLAVGLVAGGHVAAPLGPRRAPLPGDAVASRLPGLPWWPPGPHAVLAPRPLDTWEDRERSDHVNVNHEVGHTGCTGVGRAP